MVVMPEQQWEARCSLDNVLYHQTFLNSAVSILRNRQFKLTAGLQRSEVSFQKKNKIFFLSASRDKINKFRNNSLSSMGDVTLILRREWFSARYSVVPVDYWQWGYKKESEDRIISSSPYISMPSLISAIKEVWLYFPMDNLQSYAKSDVTKDIRQLLLITKINKVPIFYFIDPKAYLLGNKSKTTDIKTLFAYLGTYVEKYLGTYVEKYHYLRYRDDLSPWRELFWKQHKKDLSEKARKLAYNLVYYSYSKDTLNLLEADIQNNKKDAIAFRKIQAIWKKLNILKVEEYYEFLKKKWIAIYDAEKE